MKNLIKIKLLAIEQIEFDIIDLLKFGSIIRVAPLISYKKDLINEYNRLQETISKKRMEAKKNRYIKKRRLQMQILYP